MAFTLQSFGKASTSLVPTQVLQSGSISGNPNIWAYYTLDNLSATLASNYFSQVAGTVLVGDLIYIYASDLNGLAAVRTIDITVFPNTITTQLSFSGSVTEVDTGVGLTGGPITTTGTVALANTAVTPGSYTSTNLTVDQQGRITSASNGSSGGSVVEVNTGAGLTGGPITTSGTISLETTGVTPGSYTFTNLTVNAEGQITAASSGLLGPFSAGSVIFSNGSELTQDNANFNWNDATSSLVVKQPSSVLTLNTVLTVTSDPSGAHGHGNHIAIDGNPGGGGTIFRTDGGLNDSWIQIYGGDYTGTQSGGLYVNGNNSTGGDAGGVQTTFGLSSSSFQMYDYTQSILLFQLDNNGVLQLPKLTASRAVETDASSNLVSSATTSTELGYVNGVTSSIQAQLNALSARITALGG